MSSLQVIAVMLTVLVAALTIKNILLMLKAMKQKDVRGAGIRIQRIATGLVALLFAFLILCNHLGAVIPTLVGWGMLVTSILLPQKYFQWVAQKLMKQ